MVASEDWKRAQRKALADHKWDTGFIKCTTCGVPYEHVIIHLTPCGIYVVPVIKNKELDFIPQAEMKDATQEV